MQNAEKNKPQKPSAADYGLIADLVMQMQTDYDNGLREFQDAIHYSIGHLAMIPEEDIIFDQRKENVEYLMDLCGRLKKIEFILTAQTLSHE